MGKAVFLGLSSLVLVFLVLCVVKRLEIGDESRPYVFLFFGVARFAVESKKVVNRFILWSKIFIKERSNVSHLIATNF